MLKIKKIKPLFNRIVVTADKYTGDVTSNSLVVKTAGTLKEYQKVISVGTTVNSVKEGDLVLINPSRYAVRKHQDGSLKDGVITDNPVTQYHFNMIEINEQQCILLYDSDIDYIIEDYSEEADVKSTIITPDTPKIII